MTSNPPSSLNFLSGKGKWYVYVTIPVELRPAFKGQVQLRRSTKTSDKRIAKGREHAIAAEIYAELEKARKELNPFKDAIDALAAAIGGSGGFTYYPSAYSDPVALPEIVEAAREVAARAKYEAQAASDFEEAVTGARATPKIDEALAKVEHAYTVATGAAPKTQLLSELAKDWLGKHTFGKAKTKDAAEKAIEHFIDVVGDPRIGDITKKDAYAFAKDQNSKLAAKTIANRIGYVSQCLGYAEREGILPVNPFASLSLKGYGRKEQSYTPLDKAQIEALFGLAMPDEDRKLLSILIATGMRLDEAALLTWEDLKEQDSIPFFDLTGKDKKLKNIGSARKVPVVPELMKALGKKAVGAKGRLFSYPLDKDGKAQSAASKALMRHVKKVRGTDTSKVVHSLRGSFKDFLRDESVPKEINDFITGHGSGDVAGSYGSGPSLKARYDAMCKVKHPWIK